MAEEGKVVLMNRSRIERTVKRMAYQIAEQAKGRPLILVGMDRAGAILAERTCRILKEAGTSSIWQFEIETNRLEKVPDLTKEVANLDRCMLVLFSDVIFTGQTLYSTLGRLPVTSTSVTTVAVLVDRGHRRVPVTPGFTGLEIPTKPREMIEVVLDEDREEVTLFRADNE